MKHKKHYKAATAEMLCLDIAGSAPCVSVESILNFIRVTNN